jgi:hypothetical protein
MYGEGVFLVPRRVDRPRAVVSSSATNVKSPFGDLHLGRATVAACDDFDADAHGVRPTRSTSA